MKIFTKKDAGFTLIELMIASAISLTLLSAVYSIFVLSNRSYSSQEDLADLQQNARAAVALISAELLNLQWISAIDCTPSYSSITFYHVAEAGSASAGAVSNLTDSGKTWETNKWQGDKIIILGGTGSESDSGTSTGTNTATTLNDTGKSWTANEWQNFSVVITGGTGLGQIRTVTSNTVTQLTVSSAWTTTPDSTSTYVVRQVGDIASNTSDQLTLSSNWAVTPDNTSLFAILTTKGFSRDYLNDEIDYTLRGATEPFADNVVSLSFQGYDSSDTTTCNPAEMVKLEVTLIGETASPDAMNGEYRNYTVNTTIQVEN
jgi:prepilin-type N-terminal cleavage/methylation domain-containing protein